MREDWETRRARLNHDWLAKVYASRMGAWRSVLEGLVRDDAFVSRFIDHDFAEWEQRSRQMEALIRDFPMEMSPRVLFTRHPLSHLDPSSSRWLADITESLWRWRCDVDALVERCMFLLDRANGLYWQLRDVVLAAAATGQPLVALRPEISRFVEFQKACSELSEAISLFPHDIRPA